MRPKLWCGTGALLTLTGHTNDIESVSFSADGLILPRRHREALGCQWTDSTSVEVVLQALDSNNMSAPDLGAAHVVFGSDQLLGGSPEAFSFGRQWRSPRLAGMAAGGR